MQRRKRRKRRLGIGELETERVEFGQLEALR